MDDYSDIINLSHHTSDKRAPMSRSARAAQFAPFAALTGYDDIILETAKESEAAQKERENLQKSPIDDI